MANIVWNSLSFYGTREALREAMVLLSQALSFEFTPTNAGMVCRPLHDHTRVAGGRPVPPLSRLENLEPAVIMPAPLRYRGFGHDGWRAPRFVERCGYDFSLRAADIPEALIEPVDEAAGAEPVIELALSCNSRSAPPRHVLQALSRRLPGIVIQCQYEEHSNDLFGAIAYIGGNVIASHDVELSITRESLGLDPDDDSDEADSSVHEAHVTQGNLEIAERVTALAQDAALTRCRKVRVWSPLTQAACDDGVAGLQRLLRTRLDFPDKLAVLMQELSASRHAGCASWLDACLYGNEDLEELFGDALGEPGEQHSREQRRPAFSLSVEKSLDLLAACTGDAEDRMFASAMVAVLSDPATRLMSGIHPIAILTDACKEAHFMAEGEGLRRIVGQLRVQLPVMPEAPMVGIDFLQHQSGARQDEMRNLMLGTLLEQGMPQHLRAVKVLAGAGAASHEHGPSLNPHYHFDADSDALLRSLLHCGLQGGQCGFELALAAGFDEAFLFRSLAHICPKEALATFVATKGDVRLISEPQLSALTAACERFNDQETLAVYSALKSEADMRGVIRSRLTDNSADSPSAPRRRRSL